MNTSLFLKLKICSLSCLQASSSCYPGRSILATNRQSVKEEIDKAVEILRAQEKFLKDKGEGNGDREAEIALMPCSGGWVSRLGTKKWSGRVR